MGDRWRGCKCPCVCGALDPYEKRKPLRDRIGEPSFTPAMGPNGGVVVTDIDLLLRHYGPLANSDGIGTFRIMEQKHVKAPQHVGQEITFRLMHDLFRKADPDTERYKGFYLFEYEDPEWEDYSWVTVNRLFEQEKEAKMHVVSFLKWLDSPLDDLP